MKTNGHPVKRCLFVSSPPIRAQHRSNSNLSKAPPPCSKFHVRKLELFPVFGKHEYFVKFLKIITILICLRPPPWGGGLKQKIEKRKVYNISRFWIYVDCLCSPHITRHVFDAPTNLTYPKIMISHTYCDSIDLYEVSALS